MATKEFEGIEKRAELETDSLLKPSQNKKGQKISQLYRFLNIFSQLPDIKSIQKMVQLENFLAPTYFDPALVD